MGNIHAHVSIESSDCDGRYSRSYVIPAAAYVTIPTNGDESDEFRAEWDFKAGVIGNALALADEGTGVEFTENGFSVYSRTEEGFTSSDFVWCHDDDENERGTYRDHTAESMGY